MKHEEWKSVAGYEGFYIISDLGRIMAINRINPIIVKQRSDAHGYIVVHLYKNRKVKNLRVHVLVAKAFLNHKPCGHEIVVDHVDHNKENNIVENLRLVTQRENTNQKHLPSTSNYTGVSWHKGNKKWQAAIHFEGKSRHLGYYKNERDAHKRYEKFIKENNL